MAGDPTPEALLRLLGLARRAGALLLGLDTLKNKARRCPRMRVYISPELSERSRRELDRLAAGRPAEGRPAEGRPAEGRPANAGRDWRITVLEDFERLRELLGKPGVSVAALAEEQWIRGVDRCHEEDSGAATAGNRRN